MNQTNCLIFAVRLWRRHGGYLIIRMSKHLNFVPHFIWAPDGALDGNKQLRHYVPRAPVKQPWKFWKSFRFVGRDKHCDQPSCDGKSCINVCQPPESRP